MKWDGHVYWLNRSIVPLPQSMWDGEQKNHITFGKICKETAKGAIKTDYKRDKKPIYAKPVPNEGHSLTNLMFSTEHAYLMVDGRVYSRRFNAKKAKQETALKKAAAEALELAKMQKLPDPTPEQIKQLSDHLLRNGGNLFRVAERMGIDPKLGDRLFDLLKADGKGIFKCEECDGWFPMEDRDKAFVSDMCTECVDRMNDTGEDEDD